MADNTKIEWADATVNYLNGCSVISAGCTNCYAMRMAGTRLKHDPSRAGLTMETKAGPVWTGETRANEKALLLPLAWKRPRRIFWNAHGDLFHESVPDAVIDRQWAVMALTPQHTHMVLTKRPERMREYVANIYRGGFLRFAQIDLMLQHFDRVWPDPADFTLNGAHGPIPNVWLGTSVEDQRAADERIPHLLATPAAVRFLSCEPLLGPVLLNETWPWWAEGINWVIAGGESSTGARPMHPDWARSLRDQCAAAGVAFHFKQWGEWGPIRTHAMMDGEPGQLVCSTVISSTDRSEVGKRRFYAVPMAGLERGVHEVDVLHRVGKTRAGRLLDGRTHNDFPGAPAHG